VVLLLLVNIYLPSPPVVRRMVIVAGTVMTLLLHLQLEHLFQELPHHQHLSLPLFKHSPVMESTDPMVNVDQRAPLRTGHQQNVTLTPSIFAVLNLDFVAVPRSIVTVTFVLTTDQLSS